MSLRFVLLAMLSNKQTTGYDMGRRLHNELSHIWAARLQQIYAELAKLEAQGLVESESIQPPKRPRQKIYSLTTSGIRALDQWLEEPPTPVSFKNDLLVKLFCMERLPNDFIIARLEERQADFEAMAQSIRARLIDARRTAPDQLGYLLTLEASLSTVEMQASWCAGKAAELREAEPSPPSPKRNQPSSSEPPASAHRGFLTLPRSSGDG